MVTKSVCEKSHFYWFAEVWFSFFIFIVKDTISKKEMIVRKTFPNSDNINNCNILSSNICTTSLSM